MPRAAFLAGAREAGRAKTYSGATVNQTTGVPQGAATLSLAVLESDGRGREIATGDSVNWEEERAESVCDNIFKTQRT